mmetsp:Transcript_108479/g.187450  ORF Transcript_108479/g.187450 Transcript_108479/m.187450 type:complete len:85 (-) Transcript_108479:808-1062(-)
MHKADQGSQLAKFAINHNYKIFTSTYAKQKQAVVFFNPWPQPEKQRTPETDNGRQKRQADRFLYYMTIYASKSQTGVYSLLLLV